LKGGKYSIFTVTQVKKSNCFFNIIGIKEKQVNKNSSYQSFFTGLMNFFDIVFTIIVILFVVLSSSRGALREFVSTFSIVFGYYAAEKFHPKYMSITLKYISNNSQAKIVTYFAIFVIIVLAGFLLTTLIKALISFKRPTFLSRTIGGLLGLTKGLLICLLIYFIVEGYIPSYLDDLYNSFYAPWLQNIRGFINGINFALIDIIKIV
jgi:membrane protein required for colicin V production